MSIADNNVDKTSKCCVTATRVCLFLASMCKLTACQTTMFTFILLHVLDADDTIDTLGCKALLALLFLLPPVTELS